MKTTTCLLLAACLLGTFALMGCSEENPVEARLQSLDFKLPDLEGNSFQLSAHQGSVVLLNFFRTTCSACQAEAPELNQLHAAFEDDDLVVVGIALDAGDPDAVKAFAKTYQIPYRVLLDNGQVADAYSRAYGTINKTPFMFVINREGWVEERLVGYHSEEELRALLRPLLLPEE